MADLIVEPIEKYGLSKKDRPKTLFSKIGIIGCGTVGQNIARMASKHGVEVVFIEVSEENIKNSLNDLALELDNEIERWGLTPGEKRAILTRIKGTLDYADLKDCEIVIDAVKSKQREYSVAIRKEIFKKIEQNVSTECIIATNSTTIVITEMSTELSHKERCVSLHFSTTSPEASVVEVARGLHTSETVYNKVLLFAKMMEKVAIPVIESPGLISVRLFVVLLNEACEILMEGVSSMENIDLTMRTCFGMPLGPFEFGDKAGLDKVFRWMENLYNEFGDVKYKASPLIKKLVRANHLGRATGRGFYEYDAEGRRIQALSV